MSHNNKNNKLQIVPEIKEQQENELSIEQIDNLIKTFKEDSLTELEFEFCKNFVSNGGNATKAVIESGYSQNGAEGQIGYNLMQKEKIKRTIVKLQREHQHALTVSKLSIIDELIEIKNGAMKKKEFYAALKAIEVINKMMGYYRDKTIITESYDVDLTTNEIKQSKKITKTKNNPDKEDSIRMVNKMKVEDAEIIDEENENIINDIPNIDIENIENTNNNNEQQEKEK